MLAQLSKIVCHRCIFGNYANVCVTCNLHQTKLYMHIEIESFEIFIWDELKAKWMRAISVVVVEKWMMQANIYFG